MKAQRGVVSTDTKVSDSFAETVNAAGKMAAPCGGMATRAVVPILTRVRRTWTHTGLLRRGLGTSPGASRTEMAERAVSPWTLLAAVCVQRLPLLSAEVNPVEQRVGALLEQVTFTFTFTIMGLL